MASNLTAILDGPAMAPPNGTVPQLDDPPNHKAASVGFALFSLVFTTLVVGSRLYTRAFITRKLSLADYSLFVGYGLYMGFCVMCYKAAKIMGGVHTWNVRLRDLEQYLYYNHVGSVLYGFIILPIKLSILVQYIQLLMPVKEPRVSYWLTIALMTINALVYLVLGFMEIWSCSPTRKAWDPLVTDGHCLDILALNISASALNAASDFVIFLLPQTIIWKLNMPLKHKIGISSVFVVALLSIAAATSRLYYSVRLSQSNDVVWYGWLLGLTALIEINFGILCACMPAAPAFVRSLGQSKLYVAIASSLTGSSSRGSENREPTVSGYILKNRGRDHKKAKGGFWTRAYDESGQDSLATTLADSDSAQILKVDSSSSRV